MQFSAKQKKHSKAILLILCSSITLMSCAAFNDFSKGSTLTKKHLNLLQTVMTSGIDEIYATTNWNEFENLPAFKNGTRQPTITRRPHV